MKDWSHVTSIHVPGTTCTHEAARLGAFFHLDFGFLLVFVVSSLSHLLTQLEQVHLTCIDLTAYSDHTISELVTSSTEV
jgi:hypothetical protein